VIVYRGPNIGGRVPLSHRDRRRCLYTPVFRPDNAPRSPYRLVYDSCRLGLTFQDVRGSGSAQKLGTCVERASGLLHLHAKCFRVTATNDLQADGAADRITSTRKPSLEVAPIAVHCRIDRLYAHIITVVPSSGKDIRTFLYSALS